MTLTPGLFLLLLAAVIVLGWLVGVLAKRLERKPGASPDVAERERVEMRVVDQNINTISMKLTATVSTFAGLTVGLVLVKMNVLPVSPQTCIIGSIIAVNVVMLVIQLKRRT